MDTGGKVAMGSGKAKALVLARYPKARERCDSDGPRRWYHIDIDADDPLAGDLTPRPSDTRGKAWIMAAGRLVARG